MGWLSRRAEPQNTIDTTRLSGDTQRPPPAWGGPSSGVADGQPRAHGVLLSKGRGGGVGGGCASVGYNGCLLAVDERERPCMEFL